MKKKNSGQIYSKGRSEKFSSEIIREKCKDSKELNLQLKNPVLHYNSNKNKKNNKLTNSTGSFFDRKRSESKLKTEKNIDNKNIRCFSLSPKKQTIEVHKDNIKDKIINSNSNKDYINVNINQDNYGFNLYKHLKENLRNKEKLCKDKLTKESYYCLDCKLSTCRKCINFNIHKGHNLIQKYLYINCEDNIFTN